MNAVPVPGLEGIAGPLEQVTLHHHTIGRVHVELRLGVVVGEVLSARDEEEERDGGRQREEREGGRRREEEEEEEGREGERQREERDGGRQREEEEEGTRHVKPCCCSVFAWQSETRGQHVWLPVSQGTHLTELGLEYSLKDW